MWEMLLLHAVFFSHAKCKAQAVCRDLHAEINNACKSIYTTPPLQMNMAWTKPTFGKAKVDRAGHILINKDSTEETQEEALTVLNNWRSSHGYPMNTFQARLRQVSKKVDENALVVQRLKRVLSIRKKLTRDQTKTMSLS